MTLDHPSTAGPPPACHPLRTDPDVELVVFLMQIMRKNKGHEEEYTATLNTTLRQIIAKEMDR
jgi:hypothetical protein